MSKGLAFFATDIGVCGIAWGVAGIVGVQLPEADEDRTRHRLLRRCADALETPPPSDIAETVGAINALLAGGARDLAEAKLDITGLRGFHRRVYEEVRKIPPGATTTYGDIAVRLGSPGAARAVGKALGSNPFPVIVPCHRVVAAAGRFGGFSARGGRDMKAKLLSIEARHAPASQLLFDVLPWAVRPVGSA